jgi:putative glutamine amidotransferase
MKTDDLNRLRSYNWDWTQQAAADACLIGLPCLDSWDPTVIDHTILMIAEAVLKAGGRPCVMSPGMPERQELLSSLDGLIIPGGPDVDPSSYGEAPHGAKMEETDKEFDRWELKCAKLAFHIGMPYIGICRGAHILNVAGGGTLIQDIKDDDKPSAGADVSDSQKHEDEQKPAQWLSVEPGTRLHEVVGDRVKVNSLHHQALGELAEQFRPVARTDDGVLEAFQRISSTTVQCGYQFHPEVMIKDDRRFQKLFDLIVSDAQEFRKIGSTDREDEKNAASPMSVPAQPGPARDKLASPGQRHV